MQGKQYLIMFSSKEIIANTLVDKNMEKTQKISL